MESISASERQEMISRIVGEALHLELRDRYAMDAEVLARWRAGEREEVRESVRPWCDEVRAGVAAGKVYRRASVVSEPLSESLSQPSVVRRFLDLLDAHRFDRVLEVGTAQGWTAALLAEGGLDVTTVEIDAQMHGRAEENLKAHGYSGVQVVLGDGEKGHPQNAPYDCVHVTASASRVSYALVEQTRPGGAIVLPLKLGFGFGALVRLTVLPGGTAVGVMHGSADFMLLRGQRPAQDRAGEWVRGQGAPAEVDVSATSVDPRRLRHCPVGADVAIAAMVPGVVSRWFGDPEPTGEGTFWILDARGPGHSWASVDYVPGDSTYRVEQAGDRRLWDEVDAAYFRWVSWGSPSISRLGLTVTPEGQEVWLDEPSRPFGREKDTTEPRGAVAVTGE